MPIPPPQAEASVIAAWLRFLARDMEDNPRRMADATAKLKEVADAHFRRGEYAA